MLNARQLAEEAVMMNEQQSNDHTGYAYIVSRALIWTTVIVLSIYITVSELRAFEKTHLYLFDLVSSR